MSENIDKQVAEINEKLDTVSANCADQVAEAKATASQLEETNKQLEAAMNEKDEMLKKEKTKSEEISAELETLAKEHDDEKKKME
jgi:K+-transporting ATPase c subunit